MRRTLAFVSMIAASSGQCDSQPSSGLYNRSHAFPRFVHDRPSWVCEDGRSV